MPHYSPSTPTAAQPPLEAAKQLHEADVLDAPRVAHSPFEAVKQLDLADPAISKQLAELAPLEADDRRKAVNSFGLGDQALLQSLQTVRMSGPAQLLELTDFGHEVIDAAGLAEDEQLTDDDRDRLDAVVLDPEVVKPL